MLPSQFIVDLLELPDDGFGIEGGFIHINKQDIFLDLLDHWLEEFIYLP